MNGRVYDPALGRFLSVDPVFQFPTNTQSLNPYTYVLNSPLTMTDPTGLTGENMEELKDGASAVAGSAEEAGGGGGEGGGIQITWTKTATTFVNEGGGGSSSASGAMGVAGGQVIEFAKDPNTIGDVSNRGQSSDGNNPTVSGNASPKTTGNTSDDNKLAKRLAEKARAHGKLENAHGKRIKAGTVSGTPDDFTVDVALAVQHTIKGGGNREIEQLENGGNDVIVVYMKDSPGQYAGQLKDGTHVIAWDSRIGIRVDDGGIQSPATGLSHEFGHASDYQLNGAKYRAAALDNKIDLPEDPIIFGIERKVTAHWGEDTLGLPLNFYQVSRFREWLILN